MFSSNKIINVIAAFGLLLIAALGGGYYVTLSIDSKIDRLSNLNYSNHVVKAADRSVSAGSIDFIDAAALSTPSVVHITASESDNLFKKRTERERPSDPFSQFFGNDFFFNGSPYGGQFHNKSGSGSGVIISEDGYIVTNNHVLEFADEYLVKLTDNRTFKGVLVGRDPKTDLAVIKIEGEGLRAIQYGNSDDVKVGEWVLAVGNPFSYLTSTVTAGIVSAKGRDLDINGDQRNSIESFIQTDAAVNPGNSGGALVNTEGKLIGINSAIATPTGTFAGYSFAIPVNLMEKVVDDLITYGSAQRGYLGVEISNMDEELAEKFNINAIQGVYVFSVVDGGAAQYAGILNNDVIIGVNGAEIKTVPELQEVVGAARVGDVLDVKINRYGTVLTKPVRIKAQ